MNNKQRWLKIDGNDGWIIVVPDFDDKPHSLDTINNKNELAMENCPCKPDINFIDKILVHKSFIDNNRINESLNKLK